MKRFGVRIAAGAAIILLGAIAAAQAQKDSGSTGGATYHVPDRNELQTPPAPIAGIARGFAGTSVNAGDTETATGQRIPASPGATSIDSPVALGFLSDPRRQAESHQIEQVAYTSPTSDDGPASEPEASPSTALRMSPSSITAPAATAIDMPASSVAGAFEPPAELPAPTTNPAFSNPAFTNPAFSNAAIAEPATEIVAPPSGLATSVPPSAWPLPLADAAPGLDASPTFQTNDGTTFGQNVAPGPLDSPNLTSLPSLQIPDPANTLARPLNGLRSEGATVATPLGATDETGTMAGFDDQAAAAPSFGPAPGFSEPPTFSESPSFSQAPSFNEAPTFSQAPTFNEAPSLQETPGFSSPAFTPSPSMPPASQVPAAAISSEPAAAFANAPRFTTTPPAFSTAPPSLPAPSLAAEPPALRFGQPTQDVSAAMPTQLARLDNRATTPPQLPRSLASALPGERRLEGVQSPSVVIQKRAPAEVKVGKPAAFSIHVQNVGSVEALDVRVYDQVPQGMRLIDASPRPEIDAKGQMVWSLGSLESGGERTVTMQLVPEQEGELGSVARVTFEAAAAVRTISTRPQLKVSLRAPDEVLIGQQLEIELEVANPGTGQATGVVVQVDVPEQLEHPKGRELDNLLGTLMPNETRREVLRLRAVKPGLVQHTVVVVGDDGLRDEYTVEVHVVSPELQLTLTGPSKRFLERQATYEIALNNAGSANASNVELVAHLDRGLQFVSTENNGVYDPARHAIFWSLANMPSGEGGMVPLTLLPVEEGEQVIRLSAHSDLNSAVDEQSVVSVQSLAELTFDITDSADPIEQGGETVYEIRVRNSGSRDDSNVRVALQLPAGLELLGTEPRADQDANGTVFFEPVSVLASGDELVYKVQVRGLTASTLLIKAVVQSDQSRLPVTKEESTMVYADR